MQCEGFNRYDWCIGPLIESGFNPNLYGLLSNYLIGHDNYNHRNKIGEYSERQWYGDSTVHDTIGICTHIINELYLADIEVSIGINCYLHDRLFTLRDMCYSEDAIADRLLKFIKFYMEQEGHTKIYIDTPFITRREPRGYFNSEVQFKLTYATR